MEQRTSTEGCLKEIKVMMRILLVMILAGTCFACKKSSEDRCSPDSYEFIFQNSMNIDTIRLFTTDPTLEFYSYTLSAGNKIVFTYTHHFRDCPEISDDEGQETLVFEIPQQSNSFDFNDSLELRSAKCLMHFSCFCAPGAPFFIKQGYVKGTRINSNKWKLEANLQMPWNSQSFVSFDNIFTLK